MMQSSAGVYDLSDPAVIANPYPLYDRMRLEAPVHWAEREGCWYITRYDDVVACLGDPRLSSDRTAARMRHIAPAERPRFQLYEAIRRNMLLFVDPPQHTRLRQRIAAAFTPQAVERLRPQIHAVTHALLDDVVARGTCDLILDFAFPMALIVIATQLGVPLADQHQIKQWSNDFARSISVPVLTAELAERVQQSLQAFANYLRPLITQPQDHAAPSLLRQLIAAEQQGDRLSEQELVATCMLLLIAGHETMVNLIGNGMLALLRHRDQLVDLQATPNLVNQAVEEMLRYDSPVQLVVRAARADLALRGRLIRSGQAVSIMLGAANRDPAAFRDPHAFNIRRRPRQQLAFGHHSHWCLGGALARAEAQIAITLLLQRLPGLRLVTDGLQWAPTLALRGVRTLPVAWG